MGRCGGCVEGLRPAFVRLTIEHVDGDPLEYTNVGTNVTLVDASGQRAQSILSVVPFDLEGSCPSDQSGTIKALEPGEVETRCEHEDNITWTVPAAS